MTISARGLSSWLMRLRRGRTAAWLALLFTVGIVAADGVTALANHAPNGAGHLIAVGPINSSGFPTWYKDELQTRLELCLGAQDPFCGFGPGDIPDPNAPISFPDNFPEEAFYTQITTRMTTTGNARATTVLALEAAFVNGPVAAGDQMVFGRIRHTVAGLLANRTYVFTHPYGTDTLIAEPDPADPTGVAGRIRFTEDIGTTAGVFTEALESRIGPFLRWDPAIPPAAPPGYVGDPAIDHELVGSVFGTNFVRIVGPSVGIGSPDICNPTPPGVLATDCIETDLFSILGKLATTAGVDVDDVSYSRTQNGQFLLDVFASSDNSPQSIGVSGIGFAPTPMRQSLGSFFARIAATGANPALPITVTNNSDIPPTVKTQVPVDVVRATATYDVDTGLLVITATSSDRVVPPTLTAVGLGTLVNGTLTVTATIPPLNVTVSSSAGGSDTTRVIINGGAFAPTPVVAFAGVDQQVLVNGIVTLNGGGSTGPIQTFAWTQTAGVPVTLTGANTASPTFTAPNVTTTLTFTLTVTGAGGPSTDTVNVAVVGSAPAPIANAGPDRTVAQGSTVTLDGTASLNATTFAWTQIAGPVVALTGANTATPSFVFPKNNVSVTFRLTVQGTGGTATDTIVINTVADVLTVARAEFRTTNREWRIEGSSTVFGPGVTVTIRLGPTAAGPILAVVDVDTLGDFRFRQQNSTILPGNATSVTLISTAGRVLLGVPLTIRN